MKPRLHSIKAYTSLRRELRKYGTEAEWTIWKHLRAGQMGCKFRRQHSIHKYIVDFYCAEKKLIIELDGWVHGEEKQRQRDEQREQFLKQQGFTVLRYRNEQVKYELDTVLQHILEHCNR